MKKESSHRAKKNVDELVVSPGNGLPVSLLSLPSKSSKILRGRQLLKLVMCSNVIILRSYCHQQINRDQ